MKKRLSPFFLTIFLLFLTLGSASFSIAATPSISVNVERDEINLDQVLEIVVNVQGAEAMTTPEWPKNDAFEILGVGRQEQILFENGNMRMTRGFRYQLKPLRAGNFSLGPFQVNIEGRTYTAGPVSVNVSAAKSRQNYLPPATPFSPFSPGPFRPHSPFSNPRNRPPIFGSDPSDPFQQSPGPSHSAPEAFVKVELDKKEAYVGDQIIYTIKFYTSVSAKGALNDPDFKDFMTEKLTEDRQNKTQIDGRDYLVTENKIAIFPTKTGLLKTGEGNLEAELQSWENQSPFPDFTIQAPRIQRKNFKIESQEIQVHELPPQPANFSGLVGEFSIQSKLEPQKIKMGDTQRLEVVISGKGNFGEDRAPNLNFGNDFKVYTTKPETKIQKSAEGVSGKKTLVWTLMPQKTGTLNIPPIEISYFNPKTKTYENLKSETPPSEVEANPNLPAPSSDNIENKNQTSVPISKPSHAWMPKLPWNWLVQNGWKIAGSILAIFVLLILISYLKKKRREISPEDRERSRAFRIARKELNHCLWDHSIGDTEKITAILKNYLGQRFKVKGSALTPSEMRILLEKNKIAAEKIKDFIELLEQLEIKKYSGNLAISTNSALVKSEIIQVLRGLENGH